MEVTLLEARQWLRAGVPAVVLEVIEAKGSSPREEGARMLIGLGTQRGTIGGGHLELECIRLAEATLRGAPLPGPRRFALGPSLGQCCGGVVTVRFSHLDEALVSRWPEVTPLFNLQLYGAGHVGREVALLCARLPCRVWWVDEREEMFPSGITWPAHIEKVCVDAVEGEVSVAPPGASVLVMTHNHDLDLRIIEAVLRRGDAAFVGLIGSKTKRARFAQQLAAKGIDSSALVCPIGVEGIDSKVPEVIAVAAVAQLLSLRRR